MGRVRRTSGTPQRVPEQANAADGPFQQPASTRRLRRHPRARRRRSRTWPPRSRGTPQHSPRPGGLPRARAARGTGSSAGGWVAGEGLTVQRGVEPAGATALIRTPCGETSVASSRVRRPRRISRRRRPRPRGCRRARSSRRSSRWRRDAARSCGGRFPGQGEGAEEVRLQDRGELVSVVSTAGFFR